MPSEQNKFMYKPPTTQMNVDDLFLKIGKRRKINTTQAEVSRLYDKNKNSYSKKFKMRMQLLNEPQITPNRLLESTLSKSKKRNLSSSSKSKSIESLHSK